jgi:hypothetical protein
LERGILSALPLKLTELKFSDMIELAFRMLHWSSVSVRTVAAGVLAIAKASGRDGALVNSPLMRNVARRTHSYLAVRNLVVEAFLAELEGRELRPEEVPGRVNDEPTIATVEALRRDDPAGVSSGPELDPRTLVEL